MIATREEAYDFFKFLCNATGIDIEALLFAEKNSPSTISTMLQKRELFDIYRLYMSGDYDRALNASVDFLKICIRNVRMREIDEESLKEMGNFYLDASKWVGFYNQFQKRDRMEWMQFIKNIPLLTAEELHSSEIEKSDHRDMNEVEKTLKYMTVRRYAGNGALPDDFIGFVVNDTFVMCDDLSTLISGLKTPSDNHIHITIMLKLDLHLWMSYFIIAIQYQDNTWLADDGYNYANPRAKEGIANRGSARIREDILTNSILPYQWVEWTVDERNSNRQISLDKTHIGELYIKQISQDWTTQDKIFAYLLFSSLIDKVIVECPTEEVNTFSAFALKNSNLLTDGKSMLVVEKENLNDEFECSSLHRDCDAYLQELYIPQKDNNAIVKLSTDGIIQKLDGNNTLCSTKQYNELIAWAVKEDERVQLQIGLNSLSEEIEKQRNKLVVMIEKNLKNLFPYLFSGDDIYYIIDDVRYQSFGSNSGCPTIYPVYGSSWTYGMRTIGKDLCPNCENHISNTKKGISINVVHYKQLMWLCGVTDRSKLPPYYRNYMRSDLIPYHGNTLLDNVNPIYTVKDPCSNKHPNGFGITFYLCGYCRNRLMKQFNKGENIRLHFSLDKIDVIQIEVIK